MELVSDKIDGYEHDMGSSLNIVFGTLAMEGVLCDSCLNPKQLMHAQGTTRHCRSYIIAARTGQSTPRI